MTNADKALEFIKDGSVVGTIADLGGALELRLHRRAA